MWLVQAAALALAASRVSAQSYGAPYPNSTYPYADDPYTDGGALFNQTSAPFYPSPWIEGLGDWAEAYQKAQAFVRQLTLLEKINLTTGTGWESEACVGNVGSIPRLGFHALCMQDSPVGVRDTDYVSAFDAGGTVAASWDRDIWYKRGYNMGSEHRDKGVDVQLGPVVGPLGRSPEGGRNWEGFSPDPVLSGIAVAQTVKGIQDAGVIACTKHYILNEQEHFRQSPDTQGATTNITDAISSNIDDITMHELYLWPFADAIRAGTGSIMCSYNQINNSYGCQNSQTLNKLLKGELGFQGFVMSDWGAHHSGVGSALAGMDMSMPGDSAFNSGRSFWGANMTLAILNGTVPEWRLDDQATRIMAAYYYVGRDKTSVPVNFNSWTTDTYGYQHYYAQEDYGVVNQHVDVRDSHAADIRSSASRSTVLLKNEGVLPLTGHEKFTGIFGDNAGDAPYGANGCSDRSCDNGTLAMGWGSGTANFPYLVSPLTAIQNILVGNDAVVDSVTDNYAYSQIEALASQVSHAIVFVSADSGEGYITVDGNVGDRKNLTLWQGGEELIANVSSLVNNTIVVLQGPGVILVESWYDNPNITAILWMGFAGQQAGNSIADILYGAENPAGKLPFTLGRTREDYGTDILYEPNNGEFGAPQDDFVEGIFIDYRHFDKANITPIYEFGYGLSYTTFEYSDITVTKNASVGSYTPTTGLTKAAPTLGNYSTDYSDYLFPDGFHEVYNYIYPYLNSSDPETAYNWTDYGFNDTSYIPAGGRDGSPQPLLAAGGAPGGNPLLYDVLFTVTATITNTGHIAGDEVAQLYVSLGGPNDAPKVLRNFDRINIAPGASATFTADLTRRDLSNWDPVSQNWVVSNYTKTAYVGASSRKLPLSATLQI